MPLASLLAPHHQRPSPLRRPPMSTFSTDPGSGSLRTPRRKVRRRRRRRPGGGEPAEESRELRTHQLGPDIAVPHDDLPLLSRSTAMTLHQAWEVARHLP